MGIITIKQLPPVQGKKYRALRLEALKKDPLAFGAAYEDELHFSKDHWKQKIREALFAVDNNTLVGTIAYRFESTLKQKHIAWVYGLYVKPKYRRQGIGRMLMAAVLKRIKQERRIKKIKLIASPEQKAAIRLYTQFGFKKAALLRKEIKYHRKYYDDLYMEKFV